MSDFDFEEFELGNTSELVDDCSNNHVSQLDTLQTRHRPQSWDAVIGQEHITSILKGIILNETWRFTRSYIFQGSPGSGKTTSGKLFAKAIGCDHPDKSKRPCNECDSCKSFNNGSYPDYLEVDGASYNKVEDIKVLTDLAKIYPTNSNKARIILVDEAHRLSNAAWDTMLKLLEDGVTKTIFIFATTEGDKIRPAIHSRSIVFSVRPLSVHEIARELTRICKEDGIPYDSKSIESIAYAFRGRTRDAIKTLDTYNRAYGRVVDISIKSDEEVVLEMIKSAYFNQMDDAFRGLDSLITSDSKIGGIVCNALTALYVYPNQITSSIPDSILSSHKQLLGRDIRKLIETFNEFRPESYETMKLFLIIIAEMGVNTSLSSSSKSVEGRGTRSLFRNGSQDKKSIVKKQEVKKEDKEIFSEDFCLEDFGFSKV